MEVKAEFSVGDEVVDILSKKEGVVVTVKERNRGVQRYVVRFGNVVETCRECDLDRVCSIDDPFERCRKNIYGNYTDFFRSNTTFKIMNSNNSTISSLKASKTMFKSYQFIPLLKFINSDNKRLLVADEVGLGKTIEAGHIMMELKARRELKNVLIICPSALKTKWQVELYEKFGLAFEVDTKDKLMSDLQRRDGSVRHIINYEMLRGRGDGLDVYAEFVKYCEDNERKFSLILCDEAHRLRNNTTKIYRSAQKLMSLSDAVVFLTATPEMTSTDNLFYLLRLLDDQTYQSRQVFDLGLQKNRPFIKALRDINHNVPLSSIAKYIIDDTLDLSIRINKKTTIVIPVNMEEKFGDYPNYQKIKEILISGKDDSTTRAQLQFYLSSMSSMNRIFSRTRKADVITDMSQAKRHPRTECVNMNEDEEYEAQNAIDDFEARNTVQNDHGEWVLKNPLGLCNLKQRLASSVYGYLNKAEDLEKGIDAYEDREDAKYNKLVEILKEVFSKSKQKIILFATYKNTLKYLKIRLLKDGYNAVLIDGDMPREQRDENLYSFRTDDNINVLLSSEVGTEGLDLQFCDSLVNYDLPWNPMKVEQRIGRIDRMGQESSIIHIYNIIYNNSVQTKVFERLLQRIGVFEDTIGDLEAIFDAEYDGVQIKKLFEDFQHELYSTELTEKELKEKQETICRAVEKEKINLEQISKGLENSLTNDAYFRNEIDRILKKNSYVTDNELFGFVRLLIKECLPTCELIDKHNGFFEFKVPQSNPRALINFITQYHPSNEESAVAAKEFINYIRDTVSFTLTFNQERAFKNKRVVFINLYHPIIQAAVEFFVQNSKPEDKTFRFKIDGKRLGDEKGNYSNVEKGLYYLAVYKINVSKEVYGQRKESNMMHPVVFSVSEPERTFSSDFAEYLLGKVQTEASFDVIDPNNNVDSFTIDDMESYVTDESSDFLKNYIYESKQRDENEKKIKESNILDSYQQRINRIEEQIKEHEEGIERYTMFSWAEEVATEQRNLNLARMRLAKCISDRDRELEALNSVKDIKYSKELLSINLVNIL